MSVVEKRAKDFHDRLIDFVDLAAKMGVHNSEIKELANKVLVSDIKKLIKERDRLKEENIQLLKDKEDFFNSDEFFDKLEEYDLARETNSYSYHG